MQIGYTNGPGLPLSNSMARRPSGSREFVGRIEVSGIPVSYVETAENLGVTLDSKFTWKSQVEAVTKKSIALFTA